MASPKMLAHRARMDALQPTPVYLNVPRQPKTMLPGEYAGLLAQSVTVARRQRRTRQVTLTAANDMARGFERTIPVGGPGRRRAKARRNAQAVAATEEAAGRGPRVTTADQTFTIRRGRQYDGDAIEPTGSALDQMRQPEPGEWLDLGGIDA